jgi:DNA-binding response OmpR family regulator
VKEKDQIMDREATTERPSPTPTILAVDDDAHIRRLIERSLKSEGYQMRMCVSAETALTALRERRYAVAILDVMMTGETGFQLAERIRNGEAGEDNRHVPIVFVTAEDDADSYEKSFDVGAYRYITKPFETDSLVGVVSAMLHEPA